MYQIIWLKMSYDTLLYRNETGIAKHFLILVVWYGLAQLQFDNTCNNVAIINNTWKGIIGNHGCYDLRKNCISPAAWNSHLTEWNTLYAHTYTWYSGQAYSNHEACFVVYMIRVNSEIYRYISINFNTCNVRLVLYYEQRVIIQIPVGYWILNAI